MQICWKKAAKRGRSCYNFLFLEHPCRYEEDAEKCERKAEAAERLLEEARQEPPQKKLDLVRIQRSILLQVCMDIEIILTEDVLCVNFPHFLSHISHFTLSFSKRFLQSSRSSQKLPRTCLVGTIRLVS
jgi:hypothetical protein